MKEYQFSELQKLKYGENPHQKANLCFYKGMVDYEVLFGKELSYDNILNLNEVTKLLSEFYDVNAVAITKHKNCCGVALGKNIEDAYAKAFDCDPVGAFYGTIGFSKTVNLETVKHVSSMGVKVVVAPDFATDAMNYMRENSSVKAVRLYTSLKDFKNIGSEDVKITPFGVLVQDKNNKELDKDLFKVVTKTKPTKEQIEDAIFAWKVAKYTQTDSAVIVKDFATKGIAQGQSNSALAIEQALNFACDGSKEAILATDGILYSQDAIFAAAQARISLIIQPGGSEKDKELIALADKYNIAMITTGIRNHRY